PVGRVEGPRDLEQGLATFAIDTTLKGKPARMEYYLRSSADGIVLIAGRLNPGDEGARADLARLARRTRLVKLVQAP
ncbi:MAG: hypothetical protein ACKO26_21145, partial [Planctomycetota bacterium]